MDVCVACLIQGYNIHKVDNSSDEEEEDEFHYDMEEEAPR